MAESLASLPRILRDALDGDSGFAGHLLTTTPMLCALLLNPGHATPPAALAFFKDRRRVWTQRHLALRHRAFIMGLLLLSMWLTYKLFDVIPKGFFPSRTPDACKVDPGGPEHFFQSMSVKLAELVDITQADPAVDVVTGNTGTGSGGGRAPPTAARCPSSSSLCRSARRPRRGRGAAAAQIKQDRRRALFIQPVRICASAADRATRFIYTLQADNSAELYDGRRSSFRTTKSSVVSTSTAISSRRIESDIVIDRDTPRGSVSPPPNRQYALRRFRTAQVSTIYSDLNQYHVVMEVAPRYWQDPSSLRTFT